MFGYIKPFEGNLLVKELELYKAAYCGMCRALKKYVSPLMPLSLNYDFVLLAIMRMALERTPPKIEKKRCIASPFKRKCRICAAENPSLRYAAQAGAVLTYYNLKDDARDKDKNPLKRLGGRLFSWVLRPSILRICRKDDIIAKLSRDIDAVIAKISRLEADKSCDLDTLAAASGELLALTASAGLEYEKREIAANYGMHIGKWLYIIDAYDDLKSDEKSGSFNPLILRFGSTNAAKQNVETISAVLGCYIDDAAKQLESLPATCYNGILQNITLQGLGCAARKVLYPANRQKRKVNR